MNGETIEAVFERGVFRPLTPIDTMVSEGQHVRIMIEQDRSVRNVLDLAAEVYAGLSEEEIDEVEQIATDRRTFFHGRDSS